MSTVRRERISRPASMRDSLLANQRVSRRNRPVPQRVRASSGSSGRAVALVRMPQWSIRLPFDRGDTVRALGAVGAGANSAVKGGLFLLAGAGAGLGWALRRGGNSLWWALQNGYAGLLWALVNGYGALGWAFRNGYAGLWWTLRTLYGGLWWTLRSTYRVLVMGVMGIVGFLTDLIQGAFFFSDSANREEREDDEDQDMNWDGQALVGADGTATWSDARIEPDLEGTGNVGVAEAAARDPRWDPNIEIAKVASLDMEEQDLAEEVLGDQAGALRLRLRSDP
ncbi:MAG: hypothetical protein HQL82_13140 [Magnetococcales bacterium]|nr:hypothetical protein [Magnetococcales bacterium]